MKNTTPVFWFLTSIMLLATVACGGDSSSDGGSTACSPGEQGCSCNDDNTCGDGLVCTNAICVPDDGGASNGTSNGTTSNGTTSTSNGTTSTSNGTTGTSNGTTSTSNGTTSTSNGTTTPTGLGLSVTNNAARACEVVLRDAATSIQALHFEDGVIEGRFMRRGERLAVAFIALGDAPIAPGAVGLTLSEGAAGVEDVEVMFAQCADAEGQPVTEAQIVLVDNP